MIKSLLERRVPQILGAYLAVGWVVLEFTDWAVNRYVLSTHLTDLIVASWLLLLPAVTLLAWFHGRPGRDGWSRVEKVGLALNALLAGAVLYSLFHGRDLGAATATVVVEDEHGNEVERVVPKSEFRKRVVIFFFDNDSGDPDLDWLRYGVPTALRFDLDQDLFLSLPAADQWIGRLREAGLTDGRPVPLTLMRDVAGQLHAGYFVAGSIDGSAEGLSIATSLYETRRGKLLQERTFTGGGALELIDRMGVQLERDLSIPSQHVEGRTDLPVSEILTASPAAFRAFSRSVETELVRQDLEGAAASLEEAVAADESFAAAWIALYGIYLGLNRPARAQQAIESAMDLLYKIPDRLQFELKAVYYWLVRQDIAKARATASMRAELFPDDVEAHVQLADFYQRENLIEPAIESLRRVLELDPERIGTLRSIGNLYARQGELETAVEYLRAYARAAPEDPGSFVSLGNVLRQWGEHGSARTEYERALAVDPDDIGALMRLATLDRDLGEFEAALVGYRQALDAGTTPEQRAEVHAALSEYYEFRGQLGLAIEHMRRRWAELAPVTPPFALLQDQLGDLDLYATAGQPEVALAVLDSIGGELVAPFDVLMPFGYVQVYEALGDADGLETALPGLERLIRAYGLEYLRSYATFLDGRLRELRGDCEAAVREYRRALEIAPLSVGFNTDVGRCDRKLGRAAEARAHLERRLAVQPADPETHVELALLAADRGDVPGAVEHLSAALEVWSDADPSYEPASRAREKLAELEAG